MKDREQAPSASAAERLAMLELKLPTVTPPVVPGYTPAFVPFRRSGSQIHVSGRLAKREGQVLVGKVGAEISLPEAREAARGIALELVSVLREAAGDLEKVRLVKLFAMINGAPDFLDPHKVADGASELFLAVFAERGAHARSAISVVQCPFGACMELDLLAEITD